MIPKLDAVTLEVIRNALPAVANEMAADLQQPGETEFRTMGGAHHPVAVNAEVIVRTGGGGGWGDPLERNPASVRVDVEEEFISTRSARDDYGVVLRDDLSVDQAATERTRSAIRSNPGNAKQGAKG
jgi:N-methylhydantoinase B/oxoprolinase/acetone carboxylase alpha subunit